MLAVVVEWVMPTVLLRRGVRVVVGPEDMVLQQ
jgi:hypothetical protein